MNIYRLKSIRPLFVAYNALFRPLYRDTGDYNFLRWNWILDVAWHHGSPALRRAISARILSSSPHYIYPTNKLFFRRGEYEKAVESAEVSHRASAEKHILPFVQPDDVVLDFGCGPGLTLKFLAPRCAAAVGVDVSEAVLHAATEMTREWSHLTYYRSSGLDLVGLPDSRFTFVYTFETIQHIDKIHVVTFFHEFYRVLQPGGRLLMHYLDLTWPWILDSWLENTWRVQSSRVYRDMSVMRLRY